MRLLRWNDDCEISLTTNLDGNDTIPSYAVLSHTWGADTEEVTFEDLTNGVGKRKPGYEKIRFCGEQARQDGLEYFWIDTCCINKANKAELSRAISSMFRWYRNATQCYVYLSDVSSLIPGMNEEEFNMAPWESDFRKSRWFTRGWTLQELLAPTSVEFFSKERKRLGNKSSLKQQIHEITGIPDSALHGEPLSQFSVNERLSWNEYRHTKLEEDRAYSLLGIFDVYITPIYGEGAGGAFGRLLHEIDKLNRCIQDLRLTDPRDDKTRIENTKGGLLKGSYLWILDNADFQKWRDDEQSRLFWIEGDPGKGKTMLLCGIIDELKKLKAKNDILSYFFCQATDPRINTATAVLRGLLYMLVDQQPSLVSHIRKKHDHAGKTLFEDANAWVAVAEIFTDVLRDPSLNKTYLIIDALDECISDLPKLLDFVAQKSSTSSRIRWIVSSRKWPYIEERLEQAGYKVRLSLELNAQSISIAVGIFIKQKVTQLARRKKYDEKIQDAVLEHLVSNANDTFLWVALVCQNLEKIPRWNVLKRLNTYPPGLDSLYERMMRQITDLDDADLCKQILALAAIAYRPITLKELATFVEQLEDIADDAKSKQEIISLCGSFLTLQTDTVYFVHQSAKDFLLAKASNTLFPTGKAEAHYVILSKSLQTLSRTLRRDIYSLEALSYPAEQVEQPDPDPLAASRYSCIYWIDHLCDLEPNHSASYAVTLQDGGAIDMFLREKYLYWLEALSLCKSMSKGVVSMAKLAALTQECTNAAGLTELIQDACRFILYHKSAIENSPLQAYASALLFSPVCSLIRRLFKKEAPKWVTIKPTMRDVWSACLQTLEGHSDWVRSVDFSHNSTRLATGSYDGTVRIWDAGSGECLQTFKGHSSYVTSVAFSHDSTRLASASHDMTVKIWNASSGKCMQTLKGHSDWVRSVAFSHDSTRLASASHDMTVKIWNASSGDCIQTLKGHSDWVRSVAFSHDSTQLASASHDKTVKIWNASSGECMQTLKSHSDAITSVAFSHDSTQLASASHDRTVKTWNASSGECMQTLKSHSDAITSVAFSHDSTQLASGSLDSTVKVWDTSSGECLQVLEGHGSYVWSVAFSHDSTRLASASQDRTVKVWDATGGECLQTVKGHSSYITSVAFSHDSTQLASASHDRTVKIWDIGSSECLQTLEGHSSWVRSVAFSHDSTRLASASHDKTVKIWNASSGECMQTLKGHSDAITSVAFSHDSTQLASGSWDRTVKIWDASSGACLQTLEDHSSYVTSVVFTHDSARLASASDDSTIKIWDASSGECLQTHNTNKAIWKMSFDPTGLCLYTENGTVAIGASLVPNVTDVTDPRHAQHQNEGVSTDGAWITYNNKKRLWLPSEYRPSCSTTLGMHIGIGVGSGKVWICSLQLNESET